MLAGPATPCFAEALQLPRSKNNVEFNTMHGSLKLLSYIIVLLVVIAILYSGYTSIKYWSGIGV